MWMLVFLRLVMPALPPRPVNFNKARPHISAIARATDAPVEIVTYGVINATKDDRAQSSALAPTSRILDALPFLWATVAALLVVRHAARTLLASRRLALLPRCKTARLTAALKANSGSIEAAETDLVSTPALAGLWRPMLLLPRGLLEKIDDSELNFVVRHELAHAQRRDTLVGFVVAVVTSLHWFNPLVYLSAARFRAERELACDETVLKARVDPAAYGRTILTLLERLPSRSEPALAGSVGMISSRRTIARRIAAIARPAKRSPVGPFVCCVIALAALTGPKRAPAVEAAATTMTTTPPTTAIAPSGDPRDVMTRVYDVRDLVIQVPDFSSDPGNPTTQPQLKREQILRGIMVTLTSTIDPQSWRTNGGDAGSIRELNGQLIITQTSHNHELIQKRFDEMRNARGVQLSVEVRFLAGPKVADQVAEVAPGGTWGGDQAELWTRFLDDAQVKALLHAMQADLQTTLVAAPRLTLFNGQRAYVKVARSAAYVGDVKTNPKSGELEGDVKTIESGVTIDIRASASDDRQMATLELRPKAVSLLDLIPKRWPQSPPGRNDLIIQVPHTLTTSLDTAITMPNDRTAVYRMHPVESPKGAPTTQPVVIQPTVMLVRPVVVVQREMPQKPFPLLSSRSSATTGK
jgi:beta-lactamase regulating signal transducer with metallopeptidase domain